MSIEKASAWAALAASSLLACVALLLGGKLAVATLICAIPLGMAGAIWWAPLLRRSEPAKDALTGLMLR